MKSFNKTTPSLNRKMILIVMGSIGFLVLLYAITAYATNWFPFNAKSAPQDKTGNNSNDIEIQKAIDSQAKKELVEDNGQSDSNNTAKTSIEISTRQEDTATLTIITKLYGYSNGSCKLTASNGALTTSQSADVIFQPEYSTCAGFNVSTDKLKKGTWTIELVVTSNGISTTKSVSVEVT